MNDSINIPLADVKNKHSILQKEKNALLEKVQKIEEEELHLAYFINNFTPKSEDVQGGVSTEKTSFWRFNTLAELRTVSDMNRGQKILAIETVLKESGKPMRSKDIRDELSKRGIEIPQTSFDNIVSVESRSPLSHIRKEDYGTYLYAA